MKIDLGYNAGISVYNNFRNETTLEIEDDKLLPKVLIQNVLLDYGVEPLVQNLSIDDISELIIQLNDLYEDEFKITLWEI
jgi:hypothetical protein